MITPIIATSDVIPTGVFTLHLSPPQWWVDEVLCFNSSPHSQAYEEVGSLLRLTSGNWVSFTLPDEDYNTPPKNMKYILFAQLEEQLVLPQCFVLWEKYIYFCNKDQETVVVFVYTSHTLPYSPKLPFYPYSHMHDPRTYSSNFLYAHPSTVIH